jgi:hypothetical protein
MYSLSDPHSHPIRSLLLLGLAAACWLPAHLARAEMLLPETAVMDFPLRIRNAGSDKCLDVKNGSTKPGTQTVQSTCSSAKRQAWFAEKQLAGRYNFRPGHIGGTFLNISGDSTSDGADATIVNGHVDSIKFLLARVGDKYLIKNDRSRRCLGIAGKSTSSGALVEQFPCNTSDPFQQWSFTPLARPFNLIGRQSGLCLQVKDASNSNFASIVQTKCAAVAHQRVLYELAATVGSTDYYRLVVNGSGKCLTPLGTGEALVIVQETCSTSTFQQWSLQRDSGQVRFVNRGSGRCIGAAGESTSDGMELVQQACNGFPSQAFFWTPFVSKHILFAQVADSAGNNRATAKNDTIRAQLAETNKVFARFGVELVYDSSFDRVNVDSDALYNLAKGDLDSQGKPMTFVCPDGSSGLRSECVNRFAAQYPDRVVIISSLKSGGAWTSGDMNHIVMGKWDEGFNCDDPTILHTTWLRHEFGHHVGLPHTFPWDMSQEDANDLFIDNDCDINVFDGDGYADTLPDPFIIGNDCLAPHSKTAPVSLQDADGNDWTFSVPITNVMSYYQKPTASISAQQGNAVRFTVFARWF